MKKTELYTLLEEILKTENPSNELDIYQEKLIDIINIEDQFENPLFFYFFPIAEFCDEKNSKEFWFEKYFEKGKFTEYNFALDLLRLLKDYMTNKSKENFYSDILTIIRKFENYKSIGYLINLVPNQYLFKWLVSYLTKDKNFFKIEDKAQNEWESKVEYITNKKYLSIILAQNMNSIEELKKSLTKQNLDFENKLRCFENKFEIQNKKINDLEERIEKIEVRDTIKLTLKYLYNVLHTKFYPNNSFENNYHKQIQELLKILKKKEFEKYQFLKTYLEDLDFGILNHLNLEAHSKKEREIDNIKKSYIQDYCKADLTKVVEFFKKFPQVNYFIQLHLKYFTDSEVAEKLFQEKVDYLEAYNEIFPNNN